MSGPDFAYCAAWPLPPMVVSARDDARTRAMAAAVNADWARRCPDAAAAFCTGRGLSGGFCGG